MIVVYGTKLYGKVDRVPGLFYVRTRFFHLQFIPLIPLASYVLVEGSNDERGMKISLSLKSVFTAWARTGLILIGAGYAVATAVQAARWLGRAGGSISPLLENAAWLAGACLVYWITVRFSRPSYRRAIELGGCLGLEPAVVERFLYGRDGFAEAAQGDAAARRDMPDVPPGHLPPSPPA
ncbi:MAG: hypothetical protein K6T86_05340 [Pirellulales bacterium]|nr:hypothetical protein [Pirellulales bacterium]